MNKYEAARLIQTPRPGISKVPALPISKRLYRNAGESHMFRLHDAQNARQAYFSAAVDAILVRHAQ